MSINRQIFPVWGVVTAKARSPLRTTSILTGNQCKCAKVGMMWIFLLEPVKTLTESDEGTDCKILFGQFKKQKLWTLASQI